MIPRFYAENSRERRVPGWSSKILLHRKTLKKEKHLLKQSNDKDFEQGPAALARNICACWDAEYTVTVTILPALLCQCPLGPPGSCKAAPVTPAWLSRTGTGNGSLLTGSQGKLDNLHKTTQRTSITMKQPWHKGNNDQKEQTKSIC